jgi:membrane fusion protein (multidrug efflux system)
VAPIAGVVARREVKLGNLIQANAALFRIVQFDPLIAVLNVPERNLGLLKVGQEVRLAADALAGKTFPGTIARIAPVVDATTGTFRVTCEFHDPGETLRPGMFGRIAIVYDERHDTPTIPRAALIDEDGRTSVFVVAAEAAPSVPASGGAAAKSVAPPAAATAASAAATPRYVARLRPVTVGYSEGDRVEIREGLVPGDEVITIGRNAVRDGAVVQKLASNAAPTSVVRR